MHCVSLTGRLVIFSIIIHVVLCFVVDLSTITISSEAVF